MAKWQCNICGYIYDEENEGVKFIELPPEWVCPVCGAPKEVFVKVD
jgi:rubredoxin